MRLLTNEDVDPAFIRAATTPKRGIGAATLQVLGTYAGERHISLFHAVFEEGFAQRVQPRQIEPLLEFCQFINRIQGRAIKEPAQQVLPDLLKAIDYETFLYDHEEERTAQTRWANVCEFANWLNKKGEEQGKTLIDLTQSIALINMLDKQNDEDYDAVQLSTLHAAKGLEYRHVFLVGIEEGILPHRESIDQAKLEEERRLMYGGITRAQRTLNISYCERRKQAREFVPCEPSRFIAEMGSEDIRLAGGNANAVVDKATSKAKFAGCFDILAGNKR